MTKNVQIWRVQNEFGFGPYNGKGHIIDFLGAYHKTLKHTKSSWPPPWLDGGLSQTFKSKSEFRESMHPLSGFEDLRAYNRWFATQFFRNALDATGFFLTRYSLPEDNILRGERQVVLNLKGASITAFRRCNEIALMLKKADIDHKPIKKFMKVSTVPLDMPGI